MNFHLSHKAYIPLSIILGIILISVIIGIGFTTSTLFSVDTKLDEIITYTPIGNCSVTATIPAPVTLPPAVILPVATIKSAFENSEKCLYEKNVSPRPRGYYLIDISDLKLKFLQACFILFWVVFIPFVITIIYKLYIC